MPVISNGIFIESSESSNSLISDILVLIPEFYDHILLTYSKQGGQLKETNMQKLINKSRVIKKIRRKREGRYRR